MNTTSRLAMGKIRFPFCTALLGTLAGCTTYVEQPRPREVYVQPPPVYVQPASVPVEGSVGSVGVVIRTENDFYEPLSPYGRWEVVGSYGRCWIPGRVDRDWRPYCNGNWERTDAGWYWTSDEPWAWATYHYGRWDLSAQFGWYWVPQTQWAPAWVSWHEGGGYVGWAPLQPSVRVSAGGSVAVNVALIAPRAFVFVQPRRFLQPVRPATVVVNNTTIINKTVNITNIKVVNNTVINEGPRTQIIEQASGRKVQAVPVRELRRKQEAEVAASQRITPATTGTNVQAPVRSEGQPRATKAPAAPEPRQVEKPAVTVRVPEAPAPRKLQTESQKAKPVPSPAEVRPAPARPVTTKEAVQPKAGKYVEKQQTPAKKPEKNAQRVSERPAKKKPAAGEKGATNLIKKDLTKSER